MQIEAGGISTRNFQKFTLLPSIYKVKTNFLFGLYCWTARGKLGIRMKVFFGVFH